MQLVRTEQEINMLRSENTKLNEMLKLERSRTEIHEKKIGTMEFKVEELNRKLRERENMIKDLQTQNNQKQCTIRELEMEQQRLRQKYQSKFAVETERVNQKLAKEYKEKEDALNVSVLQITFHFIRIVIIILIYFNRMLFVRTIARFVKFAKLLTLKILNTLKSPYRK